MVGNSVICGWTAIDITALNHYISYRFSDNYSCPDGGASGTHLRLKISPSEAEANRKNLASASLVITLYERFRSYFWRRFFRGFPLQTYCSPHFFRTLQNQIIFKTSLLASTKVANSNFSGQNWTYQMLSPKIVRYIMHSQKIHDM